VARPIDTATREQVKALLGKGESLSGIARILGKHENQIRRIARALGVPAKAYAKIVEKDGKRKCSRCGKWKTPGAFPSAKHTACRVCYSESSSS
jgi:hypothetical protein